MPYNCNVQYFALCQKLLVLLLYNVNVMFTSSSLFPIIKATKHSMWDYVTSLYI